MIVMNDFKREPEELIQAQLRAVERVFRSGWAILGDEVTSFEREWSHWSGASYAVGVGNGMDALEIGMRAIGINRGDEVITTPMTAFATVLSIIRAGAVPVLADINRDTAILDPKSVLRCISAKTKAVMVVHLYGQAAPLDLFDDICHSNNLMLIEDCAQAHGAKYNGRFVGTYGAFGGFSFYPTKNLGAIGDAGALNTSSAQIAEQAKKIRNYGQSARYYHPVIGSNSRLDEIQASILRERLKYLDNWTITRRKIAGRYAEQIRNPLIRVLPLPLQHERHVHHLFVLACSMRDQLMKHLKARNIETYCHYPVVIHKQESVSGIRIDPQGLEVAEKHAKECLSMPCHPFLTETEITHVIEAVNAFGT
jgi:dTDP-4-amino-4,6-dideoxygalactose transaminase